MFPLPHRFQSLYSVLSFIALIILQYPSYSGLLSVVCLPLLECKIHKHRDFFLSGSVCNLSTQKSIWHVVVISKHSWSELMKIQAQTGAMGTHAQCNTQSLLEMLFPPFLPERHKLRKMHTYKNSYFFVKCYQKQLQKHRHLNQNKTCQWEELLLRPLYDTAKSAFLDIKPITRN